MEFRHIKLLADSPPDICNICRVNCPSECQESPDICNICRVKCPSECQEPPKHNSSTFVVVGSSVAAVAILVFCAYFLHVKYYKNRRSSQAQAQHQEEETLHHHHHHHHDQDEIFINEEHGPVIDHPIWYIRTVGLEQSLISSISVCSYKKGEGLVDGTECAVCLSEFQEDETLRILPKCDHAFHIPCIDTWLTSHTNCPLCRAPIIKAGAVELAPLQQLNAAAESSEAAEEELESRVLVVENIGESSTSTNEGVEEEVGDGVISTTTNEAGEHDISNKEISVNEDEARRRSVSMDSAAALKLSLAVSNAVAVEKPKKSREIEIVAKRVSGDQNLSRQNKGSSSQNGKQTIQKSSSWNGKFSICIDIHNNEAVVPLRSF